MFSMKMNFRRKKKTNSPCLLSWTCYDKERFYILIWYHFKCNLIFLWQFSTLVTVLLFEKYHFPRKDLSCRHQCSKCRQNGQKVNKKKWRSYFCSNFTYSKLLHWNIQIIKLHSVYTWQIQRRKSKVTDASWAESISTPPWPFDDVKSSSCHDCREGNFLVHFLEIQCLFAFTMKWSRFGLCLLTHQMLRRSVRYWRRQERMTKIIWRGFCVIFSSLCVHRNCRKIFTT